MATDTVALTERGLSEGRDDFYRLLSKILAIRAKTRDQESSDPYGGDPADFHCMASEVAACLTRNFIDANNFRREGFVRTMAAYLDFIQEYGEPDFEKWDAIASTEWSFANARGRVAQYGSSDQPS